MRLSCSDSAGLVRSWHARRPTSTSISAWRPPVPGIAEVFHAHFTDHAYPVHTHDTWDLMILDDGSVDFALDRRRHGVTGTGASSCCLRESLMTVGPSRSQVSASGTSTSRIPYFRSDILPAAVIGRHYGDGQALPNGDFTISHADLLDGDPDRIERLQPTRR
ncbi:AraC family ligand binding domain-containing protein [Streptomyces globisporus]|uniref:AraC family ligand binding domain-containing protein n=1 Tax=Streptomyces globisporus TaxID=1908 RepID=UPI0036F58B2F